MVVAVRFAMDDPMARLLGSGLLYPEVSVRAHDFEKRDQRCQTI